MTADAVIQPTLLEWFGRIYLEFFDVPILTSGRDFAHEHCPACEVGKFRGLARVGWMFSLKAAAYNLIRLPRLLATG